MPRKPPHRATVRRKAPRPTGVRKIAEVYACPLHGPHLGRECPTCREARRLAARSVTERRRAIMSRAERARVLEHAKTLRAAIAVAKLHNELKLAAGLQTLAADLESIDERVQGIPND